MAETASTDPSAEERREYEEGYWIGVSYLVRVVYVAWDYRYDT